MCVCVPVTNARLIIQLRIKLNQGSQKWQANTFRGSSAIKEENVVKVYI